MSLLASMQTVLDDVAAREAALATVSVFETLPSTNTWLMGQLPPAIGEAHAALTLHQTEGRGRQGRTWHAPSGSGLCLSVAYRFAAMPKSAPALTLSLGVAIVDALRTLGVPDVSLKWPNDLVGNDCKLGGILVESNTLKDGSFLVVAGMGINHKLPDDFALPASAAGWARGVTDVSTLNANVDLLVLASGVLAAALTCMTVFEQTSVADTMTAFNAMHWLCDQSIEVDGYAGRCGPVDDTGRLSLVDDATGSVHYISSGEPVPLKVVA